MNEQNYQTYRRSAFGRVIALWITQVALLVLLTLAVEIFVQFPRAAHAQGNLYTVTHNLVGDWAQVCAGITNTVVANGVNGELRLAATVEDYFSGTEIDATRWYTYVSNWPASGQNISPTVASGLLTLNSNYLLSNATLTAMPRFFESRARLELTTSTSGRPDIGFWRHPTLGPLYSPDITVGGSRLFIYGDTGGVGTGADDFITGARDNTTVVLNNISDPTEDQFHGFRIEWEQTQARYYIDDALVDTMNLNSTVITGWVFLYHQTPVDGTTVTQTDIDWVRGGQYPSSGTYVSCAIDGWGGNWNSLFWNSTVPGNTGVAIRTRASSNGVNWGAWSALSSTSPFSITTDGRYLQYETQMSSSNAMFSPEIQSISMTSILGPSAVRLNEFQARAAQANDWRWLLAIAVGAIFMGGLGLRMLRR